MIRAIINNISWNRIYLSLDVELLYTNDSISDQITFYVVNEKGKAAARFKQTLISDGKYQLILNITNQGDNQCIANGLYWIAVFQDESFLTFCELSYELTEKLNDCQKAFLCANNTATFSIIFSADERDSSLLFRMSILYAVKTDIEIPNHKFFKRSRSLKTIIKDFKAGFLRMLYSCIVLFHPKKQTLFCLFPSRATNSAKNKLQ